MKQRWWRLLLLLALLPAGAHGENIARIDRLQPVALEQQAGQRAGLFSERRFDSGDSGVRVLGNGEWRVQPAPGVSEPLLVFYHPYTASVSVRDRPGGVARRQDIFSRALDPQYSRRALVFPLRGDGPVYVKVEGARYPLRVAVEPGPAYAAADLWHIRMLLPAIGVVLGVSLAVLLFWAVLRDRVYLLYAGAMLFQLLYALCSYGEAYAWPGLSVLARFGAQGIWITGTLATILLVYLWLDYAGLRKVTPRLAGAMRIVGAYGCGLTLVLLLSPWPADKTWFPDIANALFLLTNAIALVTLVVAWRRGQRHAAYVLIAWVPMLVFTMTRALRFSAGERAEPWLEYGLPWVLASTAVVLALGLADRMLTFRRERDSAKAHAERDGLTGVLNRGGIEHRLDWALIERQREQIPVSLLFIDLDQFKQINDRHGHALGDACLRAVTRAVSEQFQYGDQIGRLGGEEFVLVLSGAGLVSAARIGEQVVARIRHDCAVVDGVEVALTASLGVAQARDGDTVASLIARADHAMYAAKRAGGDRVMDERSVALPTHSTKAPEGAPVE
ncbi:diguanylate cyclase (GGDEF)-like protein [Pseudoxanthomonas japonensis]|uniref:sensor domain-containing diguanylate cyclase n=1 Tax=Pseudoxanthomonas TaxID=83618 RepID=UPI00078319D9|nr:MULTISPECIES: diguanylate cyclase [Pseudoxanthomonas]MBL8255120.1 diguanylate cyclase [Pseudoxanthomonas mexicana]MDR7068421.1 diguanylate cyclase (GGDEF)-like protein [Pseudoxanthomonas japonensis]